MWVGVDVPWLRSKCMNVKLIYEGDSHKLYRVISLTVTYCGKTVVIFITASHILMGTIFPIQSRYSLLPPSIDVVITSQTS